MKGKQKSLNYLVHIVLNPHIHCRGPTIAHTTFEPRDFKKKEAKNIKTIM